MILKKTKYSLLVKQNKDRIYNYALYMMKNRMDAEDVVQEVLIRTWQNFDTINFLTAGSWMMRTTHNHCIDQLRKRNRQTEREEPIDEEALYGGEQESAEDIMRTSHYRVAEKDIKEAIKELPEKIRSVFVLYEIEGLKYREISRILGIPINSVKVYLMRARERLRSRLTVINVKEAV